jgi:hypothetical protein
VRSASVLLGACALIACEPAPRPTTAYLDYTSALVEPVYSDLDAIYVGAQGLYRSCGANGGVCHNGHEYPDLRNIGAIEGHIGARCNLRRERARDVDDLCEGDGDWLAVDDRRWEIARIEAVDDGEAPPRTYRVRTLGGRPSSFDTTWVRVERGPPGATREVWIGWDVVRLQRDPDTADGTLVVIGRPSPEEHDGTGDLIARFARAGVPGEPDAFAVADPNGNGVLGRELGGALIQPGDPARSYLIWRLTDPAHGPVMPLANCCDWSRPATRALWCWVAGLEPDGANARAPIDYASCPDGPPDRIAYPEPGPECETAGFCPVQPRLADHEPTWPNVRALIARDCTGSCHDATGARGPSFGDDLTGALRFVTPFDPSASPLYARLAPECAADPACAAMPPGGPAVTASELEMLRSWIRAGAPTEPSPATDGGGRACGAVGGRAGALGLVGVALGLAARRRRGRVWGGVGRWDFGGW